MNQRHLTRAYSTGRYGAMAWLSVRRHCAEIPGSVRQLSAHTSERTTARQYLSVVVNWRQAPVKPTAVQRRRGDSRRMSVVIDRRFRGQQTYQ